MWKISWKRYLLIGFAGTPDKENDYGFNIPENVQSNNGYIVQDTIRANGGSDSAGIEKLVLKRE